MSVRLVMKNSLPASVSPYRLLDDHAREIAWANEFLDAQKVRQLSLRSLRAYAYDLLHLARWFRTTRYSLARLTQSLLLDYVRHQLEQQPSPTPQTINHRLCVLRCLYRFHHAQEIPGKPLFPRRYITRSSLGYGRRQTKITTNLRLRQPPRVIVPLSADQVSRFWKGFHTFRDLAMVALMFAKRLALLRSPSTPAEPGNKMAFGLPFAHVPSRFAEDGHGG
jgi:site-specific recombinase XerD